MDYIPKNWSLELRRFDIRAFMISDNEIIEFWKTVLQFSQLTFELNSKIQIRILGTENIFNQTDINENRFKIDISGIKEVVSYERLWVLLDVY